MDKEILSNLEQFLPEDVLAEICRANGWHRRKKDFDSSDTEIQLPETLDKEPFSQQPEPRTDGLEEHDGDVTNDVGQALLPQDLQKINENPEKREKTAVPPLNDETASHLEERSRPPDLSELLLGSKTVGFARFIGGDVKYGTGSFTSFKKAGNEGDSLFDDIQSTFFLAPLTVSKIQYVLDFYEDVRGVFQGSEGDRFLPSLSHTEERNGESDTDYLIGKNCDLLVSLVRRLVLTNGREIIPESFPMKSYELSVTDRNLYSNPDFYKKFLTKDEISVSVPKFSIDHPKLARLKYDLIRLLPVVPPSKRGALSYVVRILLASVRERRSSVNISNHKNYQRIFALMRDILGSEVRKCAMLVKNANDTYEAWALKELLLKFNMEGYAINPPNKRKEQEEFKRIVSGKVYRRYGFNIQEACGYEIKGEGESIWTIGEYLLHEKEKESWAIGELSKKTKKAGGIDSEFTEIQSRLQSEGIDFVLVSEMLLNKKNGSFFHSTKNNKGGRPYFDFHEGQIRLLNSTLDIETTEKGSKEEFDAIFFRFEEIWKGRTGKELDTGNQSQCKKYLDLSVFVKGSLLSDPKKTLSRGYSLGFLKEDNVVCGKSKTATFDARLLLGSDKFQATLSFGGNLAQFGSEKILSRPLFEILRKHSGTRHEILKHRENPDGLTPDFIIRVYASIDPENLIGTILLDTKFSKYSTVYDNDVFQIPCLEYFEELKKYFSYEQPGEEVPTKMVILYPGDMHYGKKDFLSKLNTYYDKLNNIVAAPLSLGDEKFKNLDQLECILRKYVDDIVHQYENHPERIQNMHTGTYLTKTKEALSG